MAKRLVTSRSTLVLFLFLAECFALVPGSKLFAEQSSLNLSSAVAAPLGTANLSLTLANSGNGPAGLQFTLAYASGSISVISITPGPVADAASKAVICAAAPGLYTCLITGLNTKIIASGVAATVQVRLAPNATTSAMTITNPVAVDAGAHELSISVTGSAVIAVPILSSFSCSPGILSSGGSANCSLGLNIPAPASGISVGLQSDNPALAVPPFVNVGAGALSASFVAQAGLVALNNQNATVTADLNGSLRSVQIRLVSGAVCGGSGGSTLSVSAPTVTLNVTANAGAGTQAVILTCVSSTQEVPAFSSNVTTSQGVGWLSVSPSSGLMTQVSYAGSLYTHQAAITIKTDQTGISAGSSYTGNVRFSAGAGFATVAVTMNVTNQGTSITVDPPELSFTWQPGDAEPPATQGLSVFSNPSGAAFSMAAGQPGSSWLSVGGTKTSTPGTFPVSVNPVNLAPGSYSTVITVTSPVSGPIQVPVTLTVLSSAAKLSVSTATGRFALIKGSNPASGQIVVRNAGGGILRFNAQAEASPGNWLQLNSGGATVATASVPASVSFTVDPAGLSAGVYTGQIRVQDVNSSARAVADVVMAVSDAPQIISLSQSGLTFTAEQSGKPPPIQSFTANIQGSTAPDWTVQPQLISNPQAPQGNWLSVTNSAPALTGEGISSSVTVTVNHAGLGPGQYYGSVNITAPGAVNSPRSVSVLLNVLAAGSGIEFSTGGLIFTDAAYVRGLQQQQVHLFNPATRAVNYSTATFTPNGIGWLTVSPAGGDLVPGDNVLSIQVDLSGVAAGVQTGTVSLGFDDGSIGTINIATIAKDGTPAGCFAGKPGFVIPVFQKPRDRSVLQTATAQTVRVQAVDDCGNVITEKNGDGLQITVGNNDAALDLQDTGGGIWEGTWVPRTPGSRVSLGAAAFRRGAGLALIGTEISAVVQPADNGAAALISRVENAAGGAQVAPEVGVPGGYIAIYGSNLTAAAALANTIPLPTSVNGTQLLLGDKPLPLLYAGPAQVNALVPRSLNPNTTYQLVVVRGSTRSVPIQLLTTGWQPAIYTQDLSGSGQGVVEIAGTTLLAAAAGSGSRPVQRGSEYVTIFCTGLGPVLGAGGEPPPADGAAALPGRLYQTTATATVTIGGIDAPVVFSGLTPSLVGLYQVNAQVPAATPAGDAVPLSIHLTDSLTGSTVHSNLVTIAVR